MYQLYATLKKWQERIFCTFDGGRIVGPSDPASLALVWTKGDQLVPNAKYVAFAVARWVLSNATYVGPLEFGDEVAAHLFLKHGRPLLGAWADSDTTVRIALADDARLIDEMGRKFPVPGTGSTRAVYLTPVPKVIYGVDYLYLSKAIQSQMEIYLTTPQGFKTDRSFGYIAPLQQDAAWAWGLWPGHFRRTIAWATKIADQRPRAGPRALGTPQMVIHNQLYRTVRKCAQQGEIVGRTPNIVYRLQTVSEWLGRVADARDECWDTYAPQRSLVDKLNQRLNELGDDIRRQGMIYPLAQQSLQRAEHQLGRAVKEHGGGAYRAAVGETNTATLLAQVEPQVLIKVFAVANFPTATQLVKILTLAPDQHNLQVRIYNFTAEPVAGTITWELPETWEPYQIAKPFSAPAHGYSQTIDCLVEIPDEPRPWVEKYPWSPAGGVLVRLPEPVAERSDVYLKGQLDDGRSLLTMVYGVGVGEWVSPTTSSQSPADGNEIGPAFGQFLDLAKGGE